MAYDYSNATGLYVASAVPAAVYHALSWNNQGYIDELYDDIPCAKGSCTIATGTSITVTAGALTSGVDFTLSKPPGTGFHTVTPCRALDTRRADGPRRGAPLEAAQEIEVVVAGKCGVPSSAKALALNVTVTEPTVTGHLVLYPSGASRPSTSTINFRPGETRANNAVVTLGSPGSLRIFPMPSPGSGGTVHVILDVAGYFE